LAAEEIDPARLPERVDDLFVRHRISASLIERAWLRGGAVATVDRRARYGATLTVVGEPDDASALLGELAGETSSERVRLDARIGLPPRCHLLTPGPWDWMLIKHPVPEPDGVHLLDRDRDGPAINKLLDADNPEGHGRPDDADVPTWAGVWNRDALIATGALEVTEDDSGHLRSVTTRSDQRGRGLGAAVSARLTNLALGGASGVATLGVYCDNHPARRVYERLGYRTDRTFVAGRLVRG
jgi:ribosomal protein S18 acetylase RimI-like enzyme